MRAFSGLPILGLTYLAGSAFGQWWEIPNGPWRELFNGEDLEDWSHQGDPPWKVEEGLIKEEGGSSKNYLIWPEPLENFEIKLKYRLSTGRANSGIQVRSECRNGELPDCNGEYVVCGPQLDVAEAYSGKLYGECSGFLQQSGQNIDECRNTLEVGEWMETTARINKDSLAIWFNGVHCLDYILEEAEHLEGKIFAVQSHPPYHLIEWEYIKMRDLDKPDIVPIGDKHAFEHPSISVLKGGRVNYKIDSPGPYQMKIVDLQGKLVFGQSGEAPVAAQEIMVPKSGVYILRLHFSSSVLVEKIFIP